MFYLYWHRRLAARKKKLDERNNWEKCNGQYWVAISLPDKLKDTHRRNILPFCSRYQRTILKTKFNIWYLPDCLLVIKRYFSCPTCSWHVVSQGLIGSLLFSQPAARRSTNKQLFYIFPQSPHYSLNFSYACMVLCCLTSGITLSWDVQPILSIERASVWWISKYLSAQKSSL